MIRHAAGGLTVSILLGATLLGCDGAPPEIPEFDASSAEPAVARRLAELRAVVAAAPDSGPAWGRLALSLQAHGFPAPALEAYAVARDVKPGVFAYSYLPALLLSERGDPDAGTLFEDARRLRPDYPPLLLREAEWLLDQGRPEAVSPLLAGTAAEREAPAHARLLEARAALALDDTARARDLLETAARIQPAFGAVHAQLAEVHRRAGDSLEAAAAARRSRLYPELASLEDPVQANLLREGVSSRAHILRGQAFMRSGDPGAAIEEFDTASRILPDDALVANQLGLALQAGGRFEEAAREHRRALDLRPEMNEARIAQAHALFRGGRTDEAFATIREAIAADSAATDAYLALGMFEQASGRPRAAVDALVRGLETAEELDPRIALRLAWLSATSRDAAIRDGRRAVVLAEAANQLENFTDPASLDVLAASYAEFGDFPRAAAAAERAAAIARLRGDEGQVREIERRLGAYSRDEPYRE